MNIQHLPRGSTAAEKALFKAIKNYTTARIDYEFKGAGDPADIPAIEAHLLRMREELETAVRLYVGTYR